ncbi:MAG: hypothetical protein ACI90V_000229, partial [Bacillariaceae sp.]|jgi:hypothetical protein
VTLNGDFNTSFDVCVCVWLMEVLHIVFNSTNYLGGGGIYKYFISIVKSFHKSNYYFIIKF